jgi:DNA-binding transcriptional regulator GbsR (MarR family)
MIVGTANIIKLVLDVLTSANKALSIDELAFRARTSQSAVTDAVKKLEQADVVVWDKGIVELNKDQRSYKPENLLVS